MASDTSFLNRIMLACSRGPVRLFRNSVGLGWVGKPIRVQRPEMVLMTPGDVLIKKARPLHAGLIKGSGDLIGFVSREVKPEHVGQTWAVFASVEGKEGAGRSDYDQLNWSAQVREAGGIAGEVRSVEDATRLLAE